MSLEAQARVYNQALSLVKSMCLLCAAQLGIPDLIHQHGHPMSLARLIDDLRIPKEKSHYVVIRLMCILTHFGFFIKVKVEDEKEGFILTPSSHLLLTQHPFSLTPFILSFLNSMLMEPWDSLTQWFQIDGTTPFDMTHKRARWDGNPNDVAASQFQRLFNEAMASDSRLVSSVLAKDKFKNVFHGLESVVGVGGSTGEMGRAIVRAFPGLNWTMLELPHVVAGLDGDENLSYVEGNMFDFIPPAHAVFMKWILHCWSDEESVKILHKCKEAIPCGDKGGKVMIVETVVGNLNCDKESYETQLLNDMQTMVLVNGRERSEMEWAKLFFEAGFTAYKIFPILGLRCRLIEVYP